MRKIEDSLGLGYLRRLGLLSLRLPGAPAIPAATVSRSLAAFSAFSRASKSESFKPIRSVLIEALDILLNFLFHH